MKRKSTLNWWNNVPEKHDIIYGLHAVHHAIKKSAESVLELWLQTGKKDTPELERIIELARGNGIAVQRVDKKTLDKHTGQARHQGIAVKCKAHRQGSAMDLDSLLQTDTDKAKLLLVLDGIQDPHNLGACLRTADAAGVDAVIIPKNRAVSVNATVRKVASGAAENTPVIAVTNIARTLRQMQQAGIWIIGTSEEGGQTLYELDLTIPIAIVMGAEGKGIRNNTGQQCDHLVKLPMLGSVASLNVSVATGICLYEAIRQRGMA